MLLLQIRKVRDEFWKLSLIESVVKFVEDVEEDEVLVDPQLPISSFSKTVTSLPLIVMFPLLGEKLFQELNCGFSAQEYVPLGTVNTILEYGLFDVPIELNPCVKPMLDQLDGSIILMLPSNVTKITDQGMM